MTQLKVDTITDAAGTAAPDLEDGLTINGAALSTVNTAEYYSSGTEPSSPKDGAIWWDTTNEKVMIYVNDAWYEVTLEASAGGASIAWGGDRALVGGGQRTSKSNIIDYFDITTSGNATDFGDLTVNRYYLSATGSSSRAVFGGGDDTATEKATIDYVTPSTTGNATDFGDHINGTRDEDAAGNGTRGLFGGGQYDTTAASSIEYITIDTTGNATDFGDLTKQRNASGAVANSTYCLFAGGYDGAPSYAADGSIDYVTIDTTGNASDWGDTVGGNEQDMACASDETRGVMFSGYQGSRTNQIQYISLESTGNATDFGDLTTSRNNAMGTGNGTYAVCCGGYDGNVLNVIDIFTIQTAGNATDHGDLTTSTRSAGATSGAAS